MRWLILACALYAAFQGGRAYGYEPQERPQEPAAEERCAALAAALTIDTAGRSQAELRRAWFAGGDLVGFDAETRCFYLD